MDAVPDGEVSEFLHDELRVCDQIELRGPIGSYFAWSAAHDYGLLLIAGGSGIVPLMAMLRSRAAEAKQPARLLYSSRSVDQIIYRGELDRLAAGDESFSLTHTLTRATPTGWSGERGRIGRVMLTRRNFLPAGDPDVYVCGPTAFVEQVTDHLIAMGHAPHRVRTERFGPTGPIRA